MVVSVAAARMLAFVDQDHLIVKFRKAWNPDTALLELAPNPTVCDTWRGVRGGAWRGGARWALTVARVVYGGTRAGACTSHSCERLLQWMWGASGGSAALYARVTWVCSRGRDNYHYHCNKCGERPHPAQYQTTAGCTAATMLPHITLELKAVPRFRLWPCV